MIDGNLGMGSVTLLMPDATLKKILRPLVALAAGTLLGGALFHMIPAAVDKLGNRFPIYIWIVAGFSLFFVMEQFLHWHHCHRVPCEHKPLTILILIADAVHNFIGGLAAAAHEVPQELGDFGILVHGGWKKGCTLLFNFLSALTFLAGGLVAYAASFSRDVSFLLPFAAGNFIYIAAADLIPEVKGESSLSLALIHFLSFLAGLGLLLAVRFAFGR